MWEKFWRHLTDMFFLFNRILLVMDHLIMKDLGWLVASMSTCCCSRGLIEANQSQKYERDVL